MKLYVVRHGETAWNVERKLQGWHDIPLNENGIRQAYEVREKLKDVPFDVIVASTQCRAYQTAEIINEGRGLRVIRDERFRERHYGKYEGLNFGYYNLGDIWNYEANVDFGGEDIRTFLGRIFEGLDELKEKYPDKQVLLVCHGGTTRGIACYFEGIRAEAMRKPIPKNGEITIYEA
ncbi:MAG: histidine phosphatase family protein [Lachnospiraceae bacterium]|nr:histidine phosphatase family protein [Lachnospiraceae bacterium]